MIDAQIAAASGVLYKSWFSCVFATDIIVRVNSGLLFGPQCTVADCPCRLCILCKQHRRCALALLLLFRDPHRKLHYMRILFSVHAFGLSCLACTKRTRHTSNYMRTLPY